MFRFLRGLLVLLVVLLLGVSLSGLPVLAEGHKVSVDAEGNSSSVFGENVGKENYHVKNEDKLDDGSVFSHSVG